MALAEELRPFKDRITCFYDVDGSGSIGWEVDHEGRIFETGYNDICGIVASSNALASWLTRPFTTTIFSASAFTITLILPTWTDRFQNWGYRPYC